MSSNWKKIGKKKGAGMSDYKIIDSINMDDNGWKTTNIKGNKTTINILNTASKKNVRVGIGTKNPFSRLSLGKNNNNSKENVQTHGAIGAIALHEDKTGKNFHGLIFNEKIKDLKYLTDNRWGAKTPTPRKTTSACIISAAKNNDEFSIDPSSAIYISEHNLVTVGGRPVHDLGIDFEDDSDENPDNLREGEGSKLKLHVKGGIHVDGYISMYNENLIENKKASWKNPPYKTYKTVPYGSLFVGKSRASGENNQLALYIKTKKYQNGLEIGSEAIQNKKIIGSRNEGNLFWDGSGSEINKPQSYPYTSRILYKNASAIFNADVWTAGSDSKGLINETQNNDNLKKISNACFSAAEYKIRNSVTCIGGGMAACERSNINFHNDGDHTRFTQFICNPISYKFNKKINCKSVLPVTELYSDVPIELDGEHGIHHNGGQIWAQKQISIGPHMNRHISFNEAFLNIATGAKIDRVNDEILDARCDGVPGIIIGGDMSRKFENNVNAEDSHYKIGLEGASNAILLGCSGQIGNIYDCKNSIIINHGGISGELNAPNSMIIGTNNEVKCISGSLLVLGTNNTVIEDSDSIIIGKKNKIDCSTNNQDGGGNIILGNNNKCFIRGPYYNYKKCNNIIGSNNTLVSSEFSSIQGKNNSVYGKFANVFGISNEIGTGTIEDSHIDPKSFVENITVFGQKNKIKFDTNPGIASKTAKNIHIFGYNNTYDMSGGEPNMDNDTTILMGSYAYARAEPRSSTNEFPYETNLALAIGSSRGPLAPLPKNIKLGFDPTTHELHENNKNIFIIDTCGNVFCNSITANQISSTASSLTAHDPSYGIPFNIDTKTTKFSDFLVFADEDWDGPGSTSRPTFYNIDNVNKATLYVPNLKVYGTASIITSQLSCKLSSSSSVGLYMYGKDISRCGNITANNFTDGTARVTNGNIENVKNIYANNYIGSGNLTVEGDISANNYIGTGNLTVEGDISANTIYYHNLSYIGSDYTESGNLTVEGDIFANNYIGAGNLTIEGDISANNLTVEEDISANNYYGLGNLTIKGDISANNYYGLGNLTVEEDISANNLTITGDISANNYIGSGNLTIKGDISAKNFYANNDYAPSFIDLTSASVPINHRDYNILDVKGDPGNSNSLVIDDTPLEIGVHLFITALSEDPVLVDLSGAGEEAGRIECSGNMITTILICSKNRGITLGKVAPSWL